MQPAQYIKVWDPFIRFFHWSLVISFIIAYLSEDSINLHSYAGYTVAGLLLFRLIWGFIGSPYARFDNFIYKPSTVGAYLKDVKALKAKRYLGHNPAGGLMIIAILLSLLIVSVSGIVVLGMEEEAGWLSSYVAQLIPIGEDNAEAIHEFFADLCLILVAMHIVGVLFGSFIHKENLIKSMVTGNKRQ